MPQEQKINPGTNTIPYKIVISELDKERQQFRPYESRSTKLPRVFWKMILALGCALLALYGSGELMLWLHPPNEIDAACLNKSLVEIGQCINDFKAPKER